MIVLSAFLLQAREYRASMNRTVTDPSGAPLRGVTVKVTGLERNVSHSIVSGEAGNHLIPFLFPVKYRVSAELPGFKKFVQSGVELRVNDKLRLDISLEFLHEGL
jgi:hypothetical protein